MRYADIKPRMNNSGILVTAIVILGGCLFLNVQNKSNSKTENLRIENSAKRNSQSEKSSSGSGSASDIEVNQTSEESQESNTENSETSSIPSGSIIVHNGPEFNYRAALKLGIIDASVSIRDFYENCSDDENGFTYNGIRYNTQVIKDGHENEYHCNILVIPES